jgi:chemotaxis response regulator CheB
MNKEMADSRAEHKAKLQAKIAKAKQKRDKKVEQLKQRRAQAEKEHHQKIEALKTKAAKASSDGKAAIEARITQINNSYHNAVAKVKNSQAEKLEKMADRLDQKAQQLKTGTT